MASNCTTLLLPPPGFLVVPPGPGSSSLLLKAFGAPESGIFSPAVCIQMLLSLFNEGSPDPQPFACLAGAQHHLTPQGTPSPCLWPDSSSRDEGFFSFLIYFVLCSNPMPETTSGVFRPSENIQSINEFKANFLIFFKVCLILVPQEKMGTLVLKVQVLPSYLADRGVFQTTSPHCTDAETEAQEGTVVLTDFTKQPKLS